LGILETCSTEALQIVALQANVLLGRAAPEIKTNAFHDCTSMGPA
jgi:hypothetical protein